MVIYIPTKVYVHYDSNEGRRRKKKSALILEGGNRSRAGPPGYWPGDLTPKIQMDSY